MRDREQLLAKLGRFKYPLLMLFLGLLLLLLPGGKTQEAATEDTDRLLQQLLACTEGVGEVQVICSENGAVVVCRGAENAKARLGIIRAVTSYTGLPSDKITVLKMAE